MEKIKYVPGGSLPLWNFTRITPELPWAGEEWLVGR